MKFFYKWINKWENNYIEKKLKELDEHPERNKTSSGILQETLVFLIFAIFIASSMCPLGHTKLYIILISFWLLFLTLR